MTRDELEFSVCEYLDGTLDEADRVALEARLATDPEARKLLEQEGALTAALRSGPVPEVRWDALAGHISQAIEDQLEERVERASWALRARSPWFMAAAASVGLVLGLSVFYAVHQQGGPSNVPTGPTAANGGIAMVVEGPQEDRPAGPVVTEVSIGPGGAFAKAPTLAPYADEMDSRPTRVAIAAGTPVIPEEAPAPSPF